MIKAHDMRRQIRDVWNVVTKHWLKAMELYPNLPNSEISKKIDWDKVTSEEMRLNEVNTDLFRKKDNRKAHNKKVV